MSVKMPEIVRQALTESITDIGQLSLEDKRTLNKYVKKGFLVKGKGGPFPKLKTVYAYPSYDFIKWRQTYIDEMMVLCRLDEANAKARAKKSF